MREWSYTSPPYRAQALYTWVSGFRHDVDDIRALLGYLHGSRVLLVLLTREDGTDVVPKRR